MSNPHEEAREIVSFFCEINGVDSCDHLHEKEVARVEAALSARDLAHEKMVEVCASSKVPCGYCKGDGFTAEHDGGEGSHDENGCVNCPVQVQCVYCHATGWVVPLDVIDACRSAQGKG